eukprot:1683544-Pyramimonas_sp.AAC.1
MAAAFDREQLLPNTSWQHGGGAHERWAPHKCYTPPRNVHHVNASFFAHQNERPNDAAHATCHCYEI